MPAETPLPPNSPLQALGRLSAGTVAAVGRLTRGARILEATALQGGVSRSGWMLELETQPSSPSGIGKKLYLRVGPQPAGPVAQAFSVSREAAIVEDVHAAGVAVPRVLGVDPAEQLAVMEFVDGDSDIRILDSIAERRALVSQYLRSLVHLHRLDPSRVRAFDDAPESMTEAVQGDVEIWAGLIPADDPDPLLLLTAQWLLDRVPRVAVPPAIVHGDAGPGNFLFRDDQLAAIVDWELSHVGDPLEDLGWIVLRARGLSIDEVREWLAEYCRLSDGSLTATALDYQRVLALFKTIVAIENTLTTGHAERLMSLLPLKAIYRCQLARILMETFGVVDPIPVEAPAGRDTHNSLIAREAADALTTLTTEPTAEASQRVVRAGVRSLRYLEHAERLGPALTEANRDDAARFIGGYSSEGTDLRAELAAVLTLENVASNPDGLKFLSRIERRQLLLWPHLARQFEDQFFASTALVEGVSD